MANALNRYVGQAPDLFSAGVILRDGFGPDPAFHTLIAEVDGSVAGYATFTPGYNSDIAARGLWLGDLFVLEALRGRGVGRALLAGVAAEAGRRGARCVEWGVWSANTRAREFYKRIGARDGDVRILGLAGASLAALAREGETFFRR